MTLKEYYKLLQSHNWHYQLSDQDNPGEYLRGVASQKQIQTLSQKSLKHKALYEGFCNFIYRNSEKPLEPDD